MALACGIVGSVQVRNEAVEPPLEPTAVRSRELDVHEARSLGFVARGDELVGRVAEHQRRERPTAELLGHRLVALQDEETRDTSVVALGERAHLAGADHPNEPGLFQNLHVVPDSSLRRLERGGELRRRGRTLAQEAHDARARDFGERSQLPGVLDDEDVVELVVRRTGDNGRTYGKSRPLARRTGPRGPVILECRYGIEGVP